MSHTSGHQSGAHEEREHFDSTYLETHKRLAQEVPRIFLNDQEEEEFGKFRELKQRRDIQELLEHGEQLSEAQERWVAARPNERGPLSDRENVQFETYKQTIGKKTEKYIRGIETELAESPKASAFEGFSKISDYDEPNEPVPEPVHRPFSKIALEEVRILLNRVLGKNTALKTFFEQEIVLKYDSERPQTDRHDGDTVAPGSAVITRGRDASGKFKHIVTVDDETFAKTVTWKDGQGIEHHYQKPDFLNAAFSIARAIAYLAIGDKKFEKGDETFQDFVEKYQVRKAPMAEQLLEGGAPHTIDTRRSDNKDQQALDFLAFYLIDPDQATLRINKDAAGHAKKMFDQILPTKSRRLEHDARVVLLPASLNLTYLYKDYDPNRRPKSVLGETGDQIANTKSGMWARIAAGAVGGFALSMLAGGPSAWLGAAVGGVAGGKTYKPLGFFRMVQRAYNEQFDFYYELARSEHDKKELARFSDREESGGDRMKRLGEAMKTGGEETVRLVLLSLSKGGNFNNWLAWLYLLHNDKKFNETGGQEVTEQGYNFVMRMQRYSNQAKRIGTVICMYGKEVDPYGRKRFRLKNYDMYKKAIDVQWAQRGDREAQNATPEIFDNMRDGVGFIGLEDEYGKDLDDPNSKGWRVGDFGDLRTAIGEEDAHHLLGFIGKNWQGDKRYKLKFGAYEQAAIQRYQKMARNQFPGVYTRATAKEAFSHYNEIIPELEDTLGKREDEATKKILKKNFKQLLEDDDLSPNEFQQLARQIDSDKYTGNFGDDPNRIAEERLTGRGWLNNDLNRLNKKFAQLKFDDDIQVELSKLTDVVKRESTGAWNDEKDGDPNKAISIMIERVDRILEDTHTDANQAFKVRTWITELQNFEPRAKALNQFRRELNEKVKHYEEAVKEVMSPKVIAQSTDASTRLDKLRAAATNKKNVVDIHQLRAGAEAIARELEPYGTSDEELTDLLQSFQVLNSTEDPKRFAELISTINTRVQKFIKRRQEAVPKLPDMVKTVEALAVDIRQSIRLDQEGVNRTPAERTAEHAELVRRFQSLGVIDRDLASRSDITEQEMYQALKLAVVVLGRRIDGEKTKQNNSKKGQQKRGDSIDIDGDDDDQ